MTITKVVLKLMNGGRSLTAKEIAREAGLDAACVRDAIKNLTRAGKATSSVHEIRYTLTQSGEAKAKKEAERPESDAERLRSQAIYKRAMRSSKPQDRPIANSVFTWR